LFYEKIIFTANAPAPIGPYNQAVLKDTLYTSGQIAIDPYLESWLLEALK
jgi:2-iminobutanoate/2-iminopropanoate deaminase